MSMFHLRSSSSLRGAGFTLLEVIVSICIFSTMVLVVMGINSNFLANINVETKSDELVGMLRLSQSHATSGNGNSNWGVHMIQNLSGGVNSFTLFKGSEYVSREVSYDVETQLPDGYYFSAISLSGAGADVIFQKGSGRTSQDGFIEITAPNASVKRVVVSPQGVIQKT